MPSSSSAPAVAAEQVAKKQQQGKPADTESRKRTASPTTTQTTSKRHHPDKHASHPGSTPASHAAPLHQEGDRSKHNQRHPPQTSGHATHQHQHRKSPHSSSPHTQRATPPPGASGARTQRSPQVTHGPPTTSPSAPATSRLHHPFRANFNDHFETSTEALNDVLPVLQELRQLLRPSTPEKLTLYDPYYCSGSVVQAWQTLGIQNVLHENRDFYADITQGTIPGPYDVLVTNPPFSDDHIWRLLDFLVTQSPAKPWAFVAPDYIAAKPQYKAWVKKHFVPVATPPSLGPAGAVKGAVRRPPPPIPSIESILPPFLLPEEEEQAKEPHASDSASALDSAAASPPAATAAAPVGPEPFYIIPRVRYDYQHPLGVGHEHSHFKSMWYVWAGRHTSEVLRGVTVALAGRGRTAAPSRSNTALGEGGGTPVVVVHGYEALVEGHHVTATDRRPNPERRSRAVPPSSVSSRGGRGGSRGHARGWR